MTHFFATPEETRDWVNAEVERLGLVMREERLPGGAPRCFLWPQDSALPEPRAAGVVVDFPSVHEATLTMGVTGWTASAFPEPVASHGRRLGQQLTRSLRKLATIPLYAVSYDGLRRSDKPFAWGTPVALDAGMVLRQWRDGAVTFQP